MHCGATIRILRLNTRKILENQALDGQVCQAYKGNMIAYFGNSSGNLLADRRYELALRLAEAGDYKASIDLLLQCLDLAPEWPPIFFHLGESFRQADNPEGAQHAFEDYLTLDPEDKMGAGIKLALLGLAPEPSAISTAYVRSLFDQYAPKFEKSLVENLSYIGPELIFQAVTALHD